MLIIIAIFAYYNRLTGSHCYCNRLVKVLPEVNGYCNRVVIIVNFRNRFDKALRTIFQFRRALPKSVFLNLFGYKYRFKKKFWVAVPVKIFCNDYVPVLYIVSSKRVRVIQVLLRTTSFYFSLNSKTHFCLCQIK